MKIELEMGTTLEESTQEDIDYVETHFREGEKVEHESLGGGRTTLEEFEQCWTVRHDGKIIGFCGVAIPDGTTILGPERFLCYMSCTNADKVKMAYVKMSRKVMREIVARTRPWASTFLSLPNEKYVGSVIWHERVLKMERLCPVRFRGHDFVLFKTTRLEVLK